MLKEDNDKKTSEKYQLTEADKKLIRLLKYKVKVPRWFNYMVTADCYREGISEKLVEYIENNNITKEDDVYRWLYGDPIEKPKKIEP